MNNPIKISNNLSLYTGDLIVLKTDDLTFLKRFFCFEGHHTLFSYLIVVDDYSYFVVEVVDKDKIRLIADNGNYLTKHMGWKNMNYFKMDGPEPDENSVFTIKTVYTPKNNPNNFINLITNDGSYLSKYSGPEHPGLITAYETQRPAHSQFKVIRVGVKAKEVVKYVDYEEEKAKIKILTPFALGEQTLRNNSDEAQTMYFLVNRTVATEKSLNWGSSFELSIGTTFQTGIPFVVEGKVEMEASVGFSLGGSKSVSDSETFEAQFPVNCRGNTTMHANAMVQLGKIEVPYKARISRFLTSGNNTSTEYEYEVEGTYRGVNAFNMSYDIDEVST